MAKQKRKGILFESASSILFLQHLSREQSEHLYNDDEPRNSFFFLIFTWVNNTLMSFQADTCTQPFASIFCSNGRTVQ